MIKENKGPRISVKLRTLYDNLGKGKSKEPDKVNREELAKRLGIDYDPNVLDFDDFYHILQDIHPSP